MKTKYPKTITFQDWQIRLEVEYQTGTIETRGGDKRRSKSEDNPRPVKKRFRVYGVDVAGNFRVSLPKEAIG